MVPGVYKSLLGKILWSHGHRSLNGADGTDLSVDKTTLTFTATTWETAQTVTVTAVEDELSEGDGETVTLTHTVASAADSDYQGISAGSVAVSITDDDLPSVNVSFEQSTYTVQEGNSTTVKVKLNQSQGEMHIRRIPSNRGRTDFNVRAVELYLAAATRTHHLRNVDPTLALV